MNMAVSNYHVQMTSPVIDTGTGGNETVTDAAGNPRVVNYVIDRGTYEYQGVVNPNFDNDSMSNEEEFIAGSDMMDSNSIWKIGGVSVMSPASILFDTVTGRDYAIDYNDALVPNPQVWTEFTNGIPGTGGAISIDDPDDATNRNYRVRVKLQ